METNKFNSIYRKIPHKLQWLIGCISIQSEKAALDGNHISE